MMRKLFALLLCLMMLPMLPAMAEEAEMLVVYAQVPADWTWPCVWAWSNDGTNAFAAWPGEAMTEGEDGWYSIEVPGWVNSIIINANEGGIQTTDLSVETGKDVWITVTDAENAAVAYEQPAGEAAEPSAEPSAEPEESAAPAEESESAGEGGSSATLWIVIAVVVVAVIAVAVVVSKKKKK